MNKDTTEKMHQDLRDELGILRIEEDEDGDVIVTLKDEGDYKNITEEHNEDEEGYSEDAEDLVDAFGTTASIIWAVMTEEGNVQYCISIC